MIAIYAQDLESAQRLALKRGIPCGLWEFVCSESKFSGIEHTGVTAEESAYIQLTALEALRTIYQRMKSSKETK